MENEIKHKPITPESVLETVDTAIKKFVAEAVEADRKAAERAAEADKRAAEADKKAAERTAEAEKEHKALRALIKQVNQQIGGMGNSNGDFAQEFFFNALFYRKTLFGQEFDEVETVKRKIKKTGVEVQYDIMLVNCKSICIVEVKYKADTDDVKKLFYKMEKLFRENFPEHADKKLYLALASMSFDKHVEKSCRENGIAMIKQMGETIEVYDEHIKVF